VVNHLSDLLEAYLDTRDYVRRGKHPIAHAVEENAELRDELWNGEDSEGRPLTIATERMLDEFFDLVGCFEKMALAGLIDVVTLRSALKSYANKVRLRRSGSSPADATLTAQRTFLARGGGLLVEAIERRLDGMISFHEYACKVETKALAADVSSLKAPL
jgi:hypothetical protein